MTDVQEPGSEIQVRDYLAKCNIVAEHNSCTAPELRALRYRPDFIIRRDGWALIIEVDQDGHRNYPISEEVVRMLILWEAFDRKVSFLRVFIDADMVFNESALEDIVTKVDVVFDMRSPDSKPTVAFLFYPTDDLRRFTNFSPRLDVKKLHPTPKVAQSRSRTTTRVISLKCPRCGQGFDREAHVIRHLEKVIPCPPTIADLDREQAIRDRRDETRKAFPCGFCEKSFTHECSKYRHRKTCSAYKAPFRQRPSSEE